MPVTRTPVPAIRAPPPETELVQHAGTELGGDAAYRAIASMRWITGRTGSASRDRAGAGSEPRDIQLEAGERLASSSDLPRDPGPFLLLYFLQPGGEGTELLA